MSKFSRFLDRIFKDGYDSVDDYCNQNGLNYDDLPEPDDNDYSSNDDDE